MWKKINYAFKEADLILPSDNLSLTHQHSSLFFAGILPGVSWSWSVWSQRDVYISSSPLRRVLKTFGVVIFPWLGSGRGLGSQFLILSWMGMYICSNVKSNSY